LNYGYFNFFKSYSVAHTSAFFEVLFLLDLIS